MTPLEVLRGARELLAEPTRWTKGEYARRADGSGVAVMAEDAACWCLEGALWRAGSMPHSRNMLDAHQLGFHGLAAEIVDWNDAPERTHAEVLVRLDDAIARAT